MNLDGVEITEIGRVDDACPHCGVIFEPRPKKKATCRGCYSAVHVRKRPFDGARVLVKPEEVPELERQWIAFQDLKAMVRMLAYDSPEAAAIFEDLDSGRQGRTPIDWKRLFEIAAECGQGVLLTVPPGVAQPEH